MVRLRLVGLGEKSEVAQDSKMGDVEVFGTGIYEWERENQNQESEKRPKISGRYFSAWR